jgi:GntR family transcriptional regulator / MocR family aminotransferase
MGTTSPDLYIDLDRSRPRGLRAQVEDGLRAAIRDGRLTPGTRLPSSRALAADLSVTRGVVVDAYEQLTAEGYLSSVQGSGTVVSDLVDAGGSGGLGSSGTSVPPPQSTPLTHDFRSGLPDLGLFPRTAWGRATRAALASMPDSDLGYAPPAGLPRLRAAVADYLGRVRGVAGGPDQVMICNGFGHGFAVVLRALIARGVTAVAVEVPGYDEPRDQIRRAGLAIHPVPVDDAGLRVDLLRGTPVGAVVVTPTHQAPTGVVMTPARRAELAEWARATGGLVVEDDYDAEYRYDRHPVGALQGVLPDRVVYHGTVSKSLAPGLRLGWMVAPTDLMAELGPARKAIDHTTSTLVQATFVEFLERGDLDRHLRRTRLVYRERRDALVDALGEWLPDWTVGGVAAGLQASVTLPAGWDSAVVAGAARDHGVGVYPRKDELQDPAERSSSLALGYGTLRPDHIREGIRLLAAAVESVGPSS